MVEKVALLLVCPHCSPTRRQNINDYFMAQAFAELSEEALRNHENSPFPARKVGQPRLDHFNAILSNFYELLVLFEIVQRSLGCSKKSHSSEGENAEIFSPWRMFLNQLSWLCDFTNGGDSSSGIAVEDTTMGPWYWLAVNFDKDSKVPSHLRKVLRNLSKLEHHSPEQHEAISDEILQSCLEFSSEKFDDYRRRLLKNIKFVKNSITDSEESPETQLLPRLKHISEHMDRSELSNFAFDYVKSDVIRKIYAKYRDKGPREAGSAWYNICHYIGRLGAWARAVKVVVYFVRHQPGSVRYSQVHPIFSPPPIAPPPADHQTNLESVVKRMLPKEKDRVEMIIARLRNAAAPVFDVDEAFSLRYRSKTFRPRSHAEVLVLGHFSTFDLDFFNNDEFVGSSKPSCYCCDLYFRFHRGTIATRPTHGNVWPKWCLPPGLLEEDQRRLEWDGKIILKRMTEQIRCDILELIESDLPRRARMPDSTSGGWTAPTSGLRLIE